MILTGKKIDGRVAGQWGLCNRVVEDGDVEEEGEENAGRQMEGTDRGNVDGSVRGGAEGTNIDGAAKVKDNLSREAIVREKVNAEAISFARDLCKGAPLATMAALKAVRGWRDAGASEAMAYEEVVGTRDRNEALAAFREKRAPVFEGK